MEICEMQHILWVIIASIRYCEMQNIHDESNFADFRQFNV